MGGIVTAVIASWVGPQFDWPSPRLCQGECKPPPMSLIISLPAYQPARKPKLAKHPSTSGAGTLETSNVERLLPANNKRLTINIFIHAMLPSHLQTRSNHQDSSQCLPDKPPTDTAEDRLRVSSLPLICSRIPQTRLKKPIRHLTSG